MRNYMQAKNRSDTPTTARYIVLRMDDEGNRLHAELLTVYQMAAEDLERAKQWGWQITYQTVLAQLGLAALRRAYPPGGLVDVLFYVGILGLSVMSMNYIASTQRSIAKFRRRMSDCRDRLAKPTQDVLGERDKKRPWPLAAVVIVVGVLAVLLVFVGAER